jgi:hypothetical protein
VDPKHIYIFKTTNLTTMIKAIISITAFFVSLVILGQNEVTELPTFYDKSDGNKVSSADMTTNGANPVILFSTVKGKGTMCKQWDGTSWNLFGKFPETENGGIVKLSSNNGTYYALIGESKGWSMFTKNSTSDNWTLLGEKFFAPDTAFYNPTINFNAGNLMIYEHHYKTRKLVMYTLQKAKIIPLTSVMNNLENEIGSEFHYVSLPTEESLMCWKKPKSYKLKVSRINSDNGASSTVKMNKGLRKMDILKVKNLAFYKDQYYLAFLDTRFVLHLAIYRKDYKKWEEVELTERMSQHGANFADDLSCIATSKSTQQPIFYHFSAGSWTTGVELDAPPIVITRTIKLSKTDGGYFLFYFNKNDDCGVQRISSIFY